MRSTSTSPWVWEHPLSSSFGELYFWVDSDLILFFRLTCLVIIVFILVVCPIRRGKRTLRGFSEDSVGSGTSTWRMDLVLWWVYYSSVCMYGMCELIASDIDLWRWEYLVSCPPFCLLYNGVLWQSWLTLAFSYSLDLIVSLLAELKLEVITASTCKIIIVKL